MALKQPKVTARQDLDGLLVRSPIDYDFADYFWRFPNDARRYENHLKKQKNPVFKKVIKVNKERKKRHDRLIKLINKDFNAIIRSKLPNSLKQQFRIRINQNMKIKAPDSGLSLNAPIFASDTINEIRNIAKKRNVKISLTRDSTYIKLINSLRIIRENEISREKKRLVSDLTLKRLRQN